MNKYIAFLYAFCIVITVFAQAPQQIQFQAMAMDNAGTPLVNQIIAVRMGILEGSATGTMLYQETHHVNTGTNGVFSLAIGTGTITTGTFTTIDWSSGQKFIKTEIDPLNGTAYTLTSSTQLLSVPYALYAERAKSTDFNAVANSYDHVKLPDGINGTEITLNSPGTYLVPAGKNLYIHTQLPEYQINTIPYLICNTTDTLWPHRYGYAVTYNHEIEPVGIGENTTIQMVEPARYVCMLVDKQVDMLVIGRNTQYTVPAGSYLYIFRPSLFINTMGPQTCIVPFTLTPGARLSTYIPSGTIVTANCSTIFGYLIKQ